MGSWSRESSCGCMDGGILWCMTRILYLGKVNEKSCRSDFCFNYFYRSVHNVQIEQLWVDVTAQVGASWAEIFTQLELRFGLDINNIHHVWLLHHLFLPFINQQLQFFAESWNQHRIAIWDSPSQSPADLFGFNMIVHGLRGAQLPSDVLSEEEIELYGVDWEGLHDEGLLQSRQSNNPESEGWCLGK